MFPLINEFINLDVSPSISILVNLLHHASRSTTIYIQALIKKYCNEFEYHDYKAIDDAYGEEFDNFLEICTMYYEHSHHYTGLFNLHMCMLYLHFIISNRCYYHTTLAIS